VNKQRFHTNCACHESDFTTIVGGFFHHFGGGTFHHFGGDIFHHFGGGIFHHFTGGDGGTFHQLLLVE